MDGIQGYVEFTQRSPFEPTWANFQLGASDQEYESNLRFVGSMMSYSIRELPAKHQSSNNYEEMCNTTGQLYNPLNIALDKIPPPGKATSEMWTMLSEYLFTPPRLKVAMIRLRN